MLNNFNFLPILAYILTAKKYKSMKNGGRVNKTDREIVGELREMINLDGVSDEDIKDRFCNSLTWALINASIAFKRFGAAVRKAGIDLSAK